MINRMFSTALVKLETTSATYVDMTIVRLDDVGFELGPI